MILSSACAALLTCSKEIAEYRTCDHCKIYERDPRLIFDIELLKCETPRVVDQYPSDEIENDADHCPKDSRINCLLERRILNAFHIDKTEECKQDDVIERVPWFCRLIALAESRTLCHRSHVKDRYVEDRVRDAYHRDCYIAYPIPQHGQAELFFGTCLLNR